MVTALSGDPEIDVLVPGFPRLLPELSWFGLDRSRLLAVGTFTGAIVPRIIGHLDLVDFFGEIDGTRTLDALLRDPDGQTNENRRIAMLMLFSRGLVEAGVPYERNTPERKTALSFLARVMDQTRVWNDRLLVSRQLDQPVVLINAPDSVRNALAQASLTLDTGERAMMSADLVVFFVDGSLDFAQVTRCRQAGIPSLLVSVGAAGLRVGPLILGRGTTSVEACIDAHRNALDMATMSGFWASLVSNAVFLVQSRTTSMSLLNQYIQYDNTDSGIKTRVVRIPRSGSKLVPMEHGVRERLVRQTLLAALPARYSGYKAYEAHYSRKYIAAARQRPEGTFEGAMGSAPVVLPESLRRVLGETFGYRPSAHGEMQRNCPTGGNLGSPEALVVDYDVEGGTISLLRYVSSTGQVERVSQRGWAPPVQSQSAYLVAAVGNKGKVKYKYEWLGDNVVQLDAGVAAGFFLDASQALWGRRVPLDFGVAVDEMVDAWVAHRSDTYIKTWQCLLPKSSLVKPGVVGEIRFRRFVATARARRAVRQLRPACLTVDRVVGHLKKTRPLERLLGIDGIQRFLCPLLFINDGGEQAAYSIALKGESTVATREVKLVDNGELICQHSLSQAPVKLFFLANLPALLEAYGTDGHDRALKFIGTWVGRLWLSLEADGLQGCPAGAVAESDIVGQMNAADDLFSLFCFNIGKRETT